MAWIKLIKDGYFDVTKEVERTFGGSHGLYNHPREGFRLGLDVFHTLHCADMLRRALDRDDHFNRIPKYP